MFEAGRAELQLLVRQSIAKDATVNLWRLTIACARKEGTIDEVHWRSWRRQPRGNIDPGRIIIVQVSQNSTQYARSVNQRHVGTMIEAGLRKELEPVGN